MTRRTGARRKHERRCRHIGVPLTQRSFIRVGISSRVPWGTQQIGPTARTHVRVARAARSDEGAHHVGVVSWNNPGSVRCHMSLTLAISTQFVVYKNQAETFRAIANPSAAARASQST